MDSSKTTKSASMMTPQEVREQRTAGWCPKCGAGNDVAGYAHLPLCPTQQTTVLRVALRELEEACDAVCALRTQEVYLMMAAVPGTTDALVRLDRARRRARELVNA